MGPGGGAAGSPWPLLLVLLVLFFFLISFDSTLAFILLRPSLSCHLEGSVLSPAVSRAVK